jgi:hypothetical protein
LSGKPGSKPGVSIQGFPRISIKSWKLRGDLHVCVPISWFNNEHGYYKHYEPDWRWRNCLMRTLRIYGSKSIPVRSRKPRIRP